MVAASTTVERQTFYWVGSNTAMVNAGFSQVPAGSTVGYGFSGPWGYDSAFNLSFPSVATGDVYWGDAKNWMIQVRGVTLTTTPNPTASLLAVIPLVDRPVLIWVVFLECRGVTTGNPLLVFLTVAIPLSSSIFQ